MCSLYVAVDQAETQHDPSPALRELIQLRDQSCRGIGCSRHARSCDLDHRQDWAKGGPTAAWNLDTQSPRCHHSKDGGWTPDRDQTTGVMTWTSTLGNSYTRQPAWDPPPAIRDDAQIPRQITPPTPPAVRDREEDPDRPLLREPVAENALPKPEPTPREAGPSRRSWDDGPPPF